MPDRYPAPTILVAEDDDDDYTELLRILQKSGLSHGLRRVTDGMALLEALRDGSDLPALIILDLNMARIDGRAALEDIRADKNLKHLAVMVLTGSQAAEDMERSYLKGADYFVRKPVEVPQFMDILRAVQSALEKRIPSPDLAP